MKALIAIFICIFSTYFLQAQKDTSINAIILNEPIGYKKNEPYQIANSLLWRISGNGLTKPSYLFGTIHIGDKAVYQVPDSLIYFIKQCDGFANELSPTELMRFLYTVSDNKDAIPSYDNVLDFEPIKNKVTDVAEIKNEKEEFYKELLLKYKKELKNLKYKVFNIMDSEEKYRETFLDGYLLRIALQERKKIGTLELAESQTNIFRTDIIDVETQYGANENAGVGFIKLLYSGANLDEMYKIGYSPFLDRLDLVNRNVFMAKSIDSLSKTGSWIFTMGALHLPAKTGLVALLKKQGFTVEPIFTYKKTDLTTIYNPNFKPKLIKFIDKDSSYSILMPENAIDLNKNNKETSSFVHSSFTNSTYYRSQKVIGAGALVSNLSFRTYFTQNFFKDYNNVSYSWRGTDNVEIFYNDKNIKKEYRFIKQGEDLIINSVATNFYTKSKEKDFEFFFKSYTALQPNPKIQSANQTKTKIVYDSVLQLKYSIPIDATTSAANNEADEKEDNYLIKVHSAKYKNNSFTLSSYEAIKGEYLIKDSSVLQNIIENAKTDSTTILFEKDTIIQYNTIRKLIIKIKKNELTAYAFRYIFLYNNRVNSIKLQSFDSSAGYYWFAQFEKDFGFINLPSQPLKKFVIKNNYHVWLPDAAKIVAPNIETNSSFIRQSRDNTNGNNFIITDEKYNPFLFYNSYLDALNDCSKNKISETDTLLNISYDSLAIYPNVTYTFKNKNGSAHLKQKCIFYGETILHFSCSGTEANLNNKNIAPFFDSIKILNAPKNKNFYFTNKTNEILATLEKSTDSTSLADAYEAANSDNFSKIHIPKLKAILNRNFEDTKYEPSYLQTFVIRSIAKIDSLGCLTYVKNQWSTLKTDLEKNIYLEILLKTKNETNYLEIANLIQSNSLKYISSLNRALIEDSLALKKSLITALLKSKNETIYNAISPFISAMLDSAELNIEIVKMQMPYIETALKNEVKLIKTDETYEMQNIYYLMHLIDTSDYKPSTDLMQQIAYLKTEAYKFTKIQACIFLLQQKIEPTTTIQKLAKDVEWRRSLYTALYNKKLDKYFPAAFKTPEKMAESILYNYLYDNEFQNGGITYKGILVLQIDGKKDTAYCFIVLNEESEESKLYAVVGRQAILKATSTNIVDAKEYYNKEELTSFKKEFEGYLKKTEESENETEKK